MAKHKFIGGFFELALPSPSRARSLAEHWAIPEDEAERYANGRSALAAMASVLKPAKAWVPAYICRSVVDAFQVSGVAVAFYGVGETLTPDIARLAGEAKSGELVLAVDYFGRPSSKAFLEFSAKRGDLTFVQDSVHSMADAKATWGDWRLLSPRKLLGVADGGYILPGPRTRPRKLGPALPDAKVAVRWRAALLRFEDEDGQCGARWHEANQAREASTQVSAARMSRLSHALLHQIDAETIIERRRENFALLHAALAHMAFLAEPVPDYCPFGFVIRVQGRDALAEALIAQDIFPAVHWRDLPSPSAEFPREHGLARELLTLPCDQRYGAEEMRLVAQAVLSHLKG